MTLEEARKLRDLRNSTLVPNAPLRFRPAIVKRGDSYAVVTLGEVNRLGLEIIR